MWPENMHMKPLPFIPIEGNLQQKILKGNIWQNVETWMKYVFSFLANYPEHF